MDGLGVSSGFETFEIIRERRINVARGTERRRERIDPGARVDRALVASNEKLGELTHV